MKIIIIAGAGSRVGKTTILRSIQGLFQDSITVKLGRAENKDKQEMLLPSDYSIAEIIRVVGRKPTYLLLEGNTILKNITPDLAIFVDGDPVNRRDDADDLRKKCDLIASKGLDCKQAFILAERIGLANLKFGMLLNKLNIKVKKCEWGCF